MLGKVPWKVLEVLLKSFKVFECITSLLSLRVAVIVRLLKAASKDERFVHVVWSSVLTSDGRLPVSVFVLQERETSHVNEDSIKWNSTH